MASFKNHFLLRYLVVFTLTGLASGDVVDDLFDNDDNLLLYLAIGFLCFSVLFLFLVILMITIVTIRVQKLMKQRQHPHRDSETVIANPQVIPLSERRLTDPTKWNHYTPEIRNGKDINSATNVDYLDYMDMIIMDANKVSLPRARLDSGEKTV